MFVHTCDLHANSGGHGRPLKHFLIYFSVLPYSEKYSHMLDIRYIWGETWKNVRIFVMSADTEQMEDENIGFSC